MISSLTRIEKVSKFNYENYKFEFSHSAVALFLHLLALQLLRRLLLLGRFVFGRSLNLDVGVRFRVLQQGEQELGRLLRPTSLTVGCVPSLGLGVTPGTAHVASERNDFLLFADVLEELGGA